MAKKRLTKQEKAIETLIEAAFYKHGKNMSFDMMDLSKISDYCREAASNVARMHPFQNDAIIADAIDSAMEDAVAKYRKN